MSGKSGASGLLKGGAVGAAVLTVIGGLILLFVEYGILVPASSGEHAVVTAESSAPVDGATTSPADQPVAPQVATESKTPSQEPSPEPPVTPDAETFTEYRIEVVGRKLSATEYATSAPPGYYMKVFTAAGEIDHDDDCYAHLELYNNDILLTTGDTKCGLSGGWSTSWWPNGTPLDEGTVRVTASITSDWGATATTETIFTVRDD